jgi:hypothetical protein
VLQVSASGTRIERSTRVEFGPEPWVVADGSAVLEIVGDGITVQLAGVLRGARAERAPDTFTGVGIRVTGKNVTLRGAHVEGYKVAIHALGADGLVLEDCDVSRNFRQRLKSTPEKEAAEDWLDPHHNDAREWFTNYGAGIYVERARAVKVRHCRARAGQNGLVLDRCEQAEVTDNDFSFLSGWGIALWRSSDNAIARNACDFCVRGYSHGVYNRGQDSAGILVFEQCSRNAIVENSATHCGDGFFCFAGQEALGGVPPPVPDFDYRGRGCNENQIVANVFSYAAAHGLELTFGTKNVIAENRFEGNAICGIWGGYSRDTRIVGNEFIQNGDAGYGLERGGVNIEHGPRNQIVNNGFTENACAIHLWWDEDEHLAKLPWCQANAHLSQDNCIAGNVFAGNTLDLQLRETTHTRTARNESRLGRTRLEVEVTPGSEPSEEECFEGGTIDLPPNAEPKGGFLRAHRSPGGRELIRIDEWGPSEPSETR